MSNFTFLKAEWPELHDAATKAEALAYPDARAACFYTRRVLELAVVWLYQHDRTLTLPYQDHLSALIHEPSFRQAVGPAVFTKAKPLKDLGNQAVHSTRPIRQYDALTAVRELFHVCFWLTRTYARGAKPADGLAFDPHLLPKTSPVPPQTLAQLQTLAAQLAEKDAKLTTLLSDKVTLDEELQRLRQEVVQVKAANAARPDTHDYSEAETRDYFIDLLLKEAGWALDQPQDREFAVSGMPNNQGTGFVDYVLWGDDDKPLALVEAKRTRRDARVGQQQAKLYADCLEQQFGQRPIIFYSNGYEHWLWDDASYPPRPVQGFLKKAGLELMMQRRTTRLPLAGAEIDPAIVERYYQRRAIRRIGEAFDQGHERKALVVMATGAGKTRTVIALCDLLMRCNWVKRVLFLADRVALVNQATNAFKKHLPVAVSTVAAAILTADHRGYRPREELFEELLQRLPWQTPPDVANLRTHWNTCFPVSAVARTGLAETLTALHAQGIQLGIVTNGVVRRQQPKIEALHIRPYLSTVVISEAVQVAKPDRRIFARALAEVGCAASQAWFVGDHPVNDVLGAAAVGLRPIWLTGVHPWPTDHPEPLWQIRALAEVVALVQHERHHAQGTT